MGWAVGWEFLQRMSGKWGPVRKHRGGTVGSATATTAANGGNRELPLGPRPARRKRMQRGCWVPQPVAVRGESSQHAAYSTARTAKKLPFAGELANIL